MEKMSKERIGGVPEVMEEVIAERSAKEELKTVTMEQEIGEHSTKEDQTEITRAVRDFPPSHFLFKIENFSQLSKANAENYQSSAFAVGGYNWRLSLYPNGNKRVNEDKYISLYLVICNSNALHKDVNVTFKLFVYNKIQDKYLAVGDAKDRVRRFCGTETEWGFDQFLALDVFNDASNGYLVDDYCIFGAEIFVIERTAKYEEECLSVVKEIANNTFTWNISSSVAENREYCESQVFVIGGHKWTLFLYPNEESTEKGNSLSLYLALKDSKSLGSGQLLTEIILRLRDQQFGKHCEQRVTCKLSSSTTSWGIPDLICLDDLKDTSKGFMVDDTVIVEVEIPFMAMIKAFS